MQGNDQPPIRTIIIRWLADHEDGRLPSEKRDREVSFACLIAAFRKYGYTNEDIKSTLTINRIMEICFPPIEGYKNQKRDRARSIVLKTLEEVLSRECESIEIPKLSDEEVAKVTTKQSSGDKPKRNSDIPREITDDHLDKGSLDRSKFKEPVPVEHDVDNGVLDQLAGMGVDLSRLGIKK